MKLEDKRNDDERLEQLEMDVGALFEASTEEADEVQLSRMAARAGSLGPRPWSNWHVASLGLAGAGMLALVLILTNGRESSPSEKTQKVQIASTDGEPDAVAAEVSALTPPPPASAGGIRLPAELAEVGTQKDAEAMNVAMATYLDMGLDGDELGFDDWEAEMDGLGEDEMLRLLDELVTRGG
jgi:hypothetical protein